MRSHCPLWLDLDFSGFLSSTESGDVRSRLVEVKLYDSDGEMFYERLFSSDTLADHYEEIVRREPLYASALIYSDYYAWQHSDARMVLRTSVQCDSLYGSTHTLDVEGTTERDTVRVMPLKQFANVNIRFINPVDGLHIHFEAVSSTLETITLSPKESTWSFDKIFSVALDGDNTDIRIPRQNTDSLRVSLYSPWSGALLAGIDLAEALAKIRYDFRAQSLNDIDIVIDFIKSTGVVRVDDWDRETVVALF